MPKTTKFPSEIVSEDVMDQATRLWQAAMEYGMTLHEHAGNTELWQHARASLLAEAVNFYLAVDAEVSRIKAIAHRHRVTSSGDKARP